MKSEFILTSKCLNFDINCDDNIYKSLSFFSVSKSPLNENFVYSLQAFILNRRKYNYIIYGQ
jgi:hypothetical protein